MWSRAAAGAIAGFFLSAGLTGLVSWCLPGRWEQALVPALVGFFPLWMGIIAIAFAFRDARRAWCWLGASALASLGLLRFLQAMEWVR